MRHAAWAERRSAGRSRRSLTLTTFLMAPCAAIACASLLGVEEAQCDDQFDDECAAGGDPTGDETNGETTSAASSSSEPVDTGPPSEEVVEQACEEYCSDVIDACVNNAPQFTTESGCMTICQNMYRFDASEKGLTGNTLQCRAALARSALDFSDGRTTSCVGAGPMGPGCGGTACQNYCDAMQRFCPEEFESIPDCAELCRTIPRKEPYTDDFPGSNSLECRVYHIQLSVQSTPQRLVHCGHAAGKDGVCVDAEE